jgi:hypothetical protein
MYRCIALLRVVFLAVSHGAAAISPLMLLARMPLLHTLSLRWTFLPYTYHMYGTAAIVTFNRC